MYRLRLALARKVIDKNSQSAFSGKLEVWFSDGYVQDIRNTQTWGVSNLGLDLLQDNSVI